MYIKPGNYIVFVRYSKSIDRAHHIQEKFMNYLRLEDIVPGKRVEQILIIHKLRWGT